MKAQGTRRGLRLPQSAFLNATYTQEYLDCIEELSGDAFGRGMAKAYMKNSTAIVHDSPAPSSFIPRLYDAATKDLFEHIVAIVHSILCKVIRRYREDASYRRLFAFDSRLENLILLPHGYEAELPFARYDLFLDENTGGFMFCEFNADGSSGMNEDRETFLSIEKTASMSMFRQKHEIRTSELVESWVDEFMRIYAVYDKAVECPRIAICDYSESATMSEFRVYASAFVRRGLSCRICDVRELSFDGETLVDSDGRAVDAIWRRCVTNDILTHWEESQALLDAVRMGKVALIGGFSSHIVHDKRIFALLAHAQTQDMLAPEENDFVASSIPETILLDNQCTDMERIVREKNRWVLKPTDRYGADCILMGTAHSHKEWKALLAECARGENGARFIAQQRCTPYRTPVIPVFEPAPEKGRISSKDARLYGNLIGLYDYNGRFAGTFSRLGPHEIISGLHGGVTAASIWVDC